MKTLKQQISELTDRELLERVAVRTKEAADNSKWTKNYIIITSIITVVVWLLSINTSNGQSLDSLKSEILKLRTEQQNIQVNLTRHHKQFLKGVSVSILGVAAIGFNQASGNKISDKRLFNWIGAAVLLTGATISIDAHKWIKRAGVPQL